MLFAFHNFIIKLTLEIFFSISSLSGVNSLSFYNGAGCTAKKGKQQKTSNKRYGINHTYLYRFCKNTDGITGELPHIPVKNLLQTARLQKINIQCCKKQKNCSLNQHPARQCKNIIQHIRNRPLNSNLSGGDYK